MRIKYATVKSDRLVFATRCDSWYHVMEDHFIFGFAMQIPKTDKLTGGMNEHKKNEQQQPENS